MDVGLYITVEDGSCPNLAWELEPQLKDAVIVLGSISFKSNSCFFFLPELEFFLLVFIYNYSLYNVLYKLYFAI
jgi:hypothetical protein